MARSPLERSPSGVIGLAAPESLSARQARVKPAADLPHREDSRGIPTAATGDRAASACQPGLASDREAPQLTEVVDHTIDPTWRVRLEEHYVGDHDPEATQVSCHR